MIKKYLGIALTVVITVVSVSLPASAQTTAETEKIRARVRTLSVSKDSQVQVKFRDRTKVKGYIESVEPVTFTLKDPKDGSVQSIAYSEIESVSKAEGISTKTWLILGGVAAGAVATFLIVKPAVCDGGAQTRGIC
ncbi:MAG TPA: hypothetical protein VFI24_21915 [Pyrinomonadaceae bacterium]|nr:hypothetical protein [Pyrinomonadaceae bacterium]